jgi:hypothetical protein
MIPKKHLVILLATILALACALPCFASDKEDRVWIPGYYDQQGRWHAGRFFPPQNIKDGRLWLPGYYDSEGGWQPGRFAPWPECEEKRTADKDGE